MSVSVYLASLSVSPPRFPLRNCPSLLAGLISLNYFSLSTSDLQIYFPSQTRTSTHAYPHIQALETSDRQGDSSASSASPYPAPPPAEGTTTAEKQKGSESAQGALGTAGPSAQPPDSYGEGVTGATSGGGGGKAEAVVNSSPEQAKKGKQKKKKKGGGDGKEALVGAGGVKWPVHPTTVFVKGFGVETTSEGLRGAFLCAGSVLGARVVQDKKTQEKKVLRVCLSFVLAFMLFFMSFSFVSFHNVPYVFYLFVDAVIIFVDMSYFRPRSPPILFFFFSLRLI